jgi:hypothetical protein
MPRRRPGLRLLVVQPDEPRGDEDVDDGAWIGVEVDDEIVRWPRRGRNEYDDCYNPVEEELSID